MVAPRPSPPTPAPAPSTPSRRMPYAVACRSSPLRWAVGIAVLALPGLGLSAAHPLLAGWALYSEAQVLDASVLHPLFNSAEHFSEEHWRPAMTQRERLEGLTAAYRGTVEALHKVGLNPFLESSSLIGLLRHGGHMPWEVDGDVGILVEECRAVEATKTKVADALGDDMAVLKFACSCEEDCQGDNRRMAGRLAHKPTGVVIDVFAYAPVRKLRPFQAQGAGGATEWWERVDDHADYTFPVEALLPLQNGTFEGVSIALPNQPKEFLSWEYGRCLGTHVWPWRLLLYTPASSLTLVAILAKGAAMLTGTPGGKRPAPWITVVSGGYAAVCLGCFHGSITLLALLATWFCECLAVCICPEFLGAGGTLALQRRHRLASLLAIGAVLVELRGCFGQVWCQIDDFYFNPLRPKTWTLCLFGHCWDF